MLYKQESTRSAKKLTGHIHFKISPIARPGCEAMPNTCEAIPRSTQDLLKIPQPVDLLLWTCLYQPRGGIRSSKFVTIFIQTALSVGLSYTPVGRYLLPFIFFFPRYTCVCWLVVRFSLGTTKGSARCKQAFAAHDIVLEEKPCMSSASQYMM